MCSTYCTLTVRRNSNGKIYFYVKWHDIKIYIWINVWHSTCWIYTYYYWHWYWYWYTYIWYCLNLIKWNPQLILLLYFLVIYSMKPKTGCWAHLSTVTFSWTKYYISCSNKCSFLGLSLIGSLAVEWFRIKRKR